MIILSVLFVSSFFSLPTYIHTWYVSIASFETKRCIFLNIFLRLIVIRTFFFFPFGLCFYARNVDKNIGTEWCRKNNVIKVSRTMTIYTHVLQLLMKFVYSMKIFWQLQSTLTCVIFSLSVSKINKSLNMPYIFFKLYFFTTIKQTSRKLRTKELSRLKNAK